MVTPAPVLRERRLLMEEFILLSSEDGLFEWIDGERVPKMPNVFGHSQTVHTLYDSLSPFVRSHKLGQVYIETRFVLTDDPQWVRGSRIPDMMFIRQQRLDGYRAANPGYAGRPLVLVPDLVVEVVSPTDSYSDVQAKVNRYLADGVAMVWVLDPEIRMVLVERQGSTQKLVDGDILTGDEVIPEFQVAVSRIFEADSDG
jgi:Uma2 family endonuclease